MSITSFIINGQNLDAFGTDVLQHLDFKTLVKCRQVSKEWRDLIDTFLWDRFLVSQIGQKMMLLGKKKRHWQNNSDIMNILRGAAGVDDYEKRPCRKRLVKRMGIARIYLRHAEEKNPEDDNGWSPLQIAESANEIDVYKLFSDHLVDKNHFITKGYYAKGFSLLHLAARSGHLEICQFIIANTEDKNPVTKTDSKLTPLHEAARSGEVEICKLIIDNLDDKRLWLLKDKFGMTPLAYAKKRGRYRKEARNEIAKLLEPFRNPKYYW